MAQVDTTIYGRQPQIDFMAPLRGIAFGQQIAEGRQRNKLTEMALAKEQGLNDAYAQSLGPDGNINQNKLTGMLASGGFGSAIPGVQKSLADSRKATTAADDAQQNNFRKVYDWAMNGVAVSDTPEKAAAYLNSGVQAGFLTPEIAQQQIAEIPTDPAQFSAWRQQTEQGLLTASERTNDVYRRDVLASQDRNSAASRAVTMRGQDMMDARSREQLMFARENAAQKAEGSQQTPLPPQAIKIQQENLEAIGLASSINADLGSIEKQIEDGILKLGPFANKWNSARNYVGSSTEESRAYASLNSTLEKLRNDSLRLNKGVQTEGDAERAWKELVDNINDPGVVKQRLQEIQRINQRGAKLRMELNDSLLQNYGREPGDYGQYVNQPAALGVAGPGAQRVGTHTTVSQKGPAVNTVQDGYRFLGGNPADESSWEKM